VAIRVTPPGPPDAADEFAKNYDREPDGVWFAPGRVNLMGGPDYTEGFVLPFALGAGVTVTAARRKDRRIALVSRQQPTDQMLLDIDALEPGSVPGWAAYPAGVAWALRQAGYQIGGADIAIDADLPGPLLCHLPGPVYSPKGVLLMEAETQVVGRYETLKRNPETAFWPYRPSRIRRTASGCRWQTCRSPTISDAPGSPAPSIITTSNVSAARSS